MQSRAVRKCAWTKPRAPWTLRSMGRRACDPWLSLRFGKLFWKLWGSKSLRQSKQIGAKQNTIGPPDSSPLIVCCTKICTAKFVHVLGCGAQQGRCRMETLQQSLELVQVLFGQFPKPRVCSPHPRDSWSAALPFAAADAEETPHLWSHVTIIVSWSILWPMSCARSTFATAFPETLYEAHHPTSSWTCLKNIYNRHWQWCSCSRKSLAKRTWDPLALSGNAEPVNHSSTDKARESN